MKYIYEVIEEVINTKFYLQILFMF